MTACRQSHRRAVFAHLRAVELSQSVACHSIGWVIIWGSATFGSRTLRLRATCIKGFLYSQQPRRALWSPRPLRHVAIVMSAYARLLRLSDLQRLRSSLIQFSRASLCRLARPLIVPW